MCAAVDRSGECGAGKDQQQLKEQQRAERCSLEKCLQVELEVAVPASAISPVAAALSFLSLQDQ